MDTLYSLYSDEFYKWEKNYNPSHYFIEGGRTIPYDFHFMCSNLWGLFKPQRGTFFEMFRESMLNTASNYRSNISLKDALWETVKQFNIE